MNKKQENLYDTNREYWMDIQLNTTKCQDCSRYMNPMESTPVKIAEQAYKFICKHCDGQNNLSEHINKLNEQSKARGAAGTLTNDMDHWASYGVYNIGQFQLYLEREFEHNMAKDERRN